MVHACVNLAVVDIAVAELKSALRESVYVTPAIVNQLRYISLFDVLAYGPRDATFAASDITALPLMGRFGLLYNSFLTGMRFSLNDDVPKVAESINRISRLEAWFNESSTRSGDSSSYTWCSQWPHARARWCHQS